MRGLGQPPQRGPRPGSPRPYRLAVTSTHPIQYQAPLWRQLAASGLDVTVYYGSTYLSERGFDPGFGTEFAWDVPLLEGYHYEVLPSWPLPRILGPLRKRWGSGDRVPTGLAARLHEGGFDAVLVHGYVSGMSLAALVAAWRVGVPVIMRGDTHAHGRGVTLKTRLWQGMLRLLLHPVNTYLAIGSWNREYWLQLGARPEQIVTSLFAVNTDYLRGRLAAEPDRAAALRKAWGAAKDDVVFIFSGKFVPTKDPMLLLRAFAHLGKRPDAHLVMVGAGPLEKTLRELQSELEIERIHWSGFVNQKEIAHFYAASDVLIMPSRYDAWGLSINEAQACGCACIVSDAVGAGPDLVEGFGAGMMFPSGDLTKLATCLEQAMNEESRSTWRARSVAAAEAASLSHNVDALHKVMEDLRRAGETASR
jgi:glycosyltransferase involved in cell wall biosynthesis